MALTAGCRSDPELSPSPIPPAYAALMASGGVKQASKAPRTRRKGERVLDGVIASIGDKFLTRREVERRLRLAPTDPVGETDRELEIDRERVRWAEQQLLVKAARQTGISVPSDRLDEYAGDRLEKMMKIASKDLGRPVSREDYLGERRLTWTEFTSQMREELMAELYVAKLRDGIQGTRPVIDRGVSPAEVRRLYQDNRKLFDIPAGARLVLFQFNTKALSDETHTALEWEALARRRAEQLGMLFRQGHDAKRLARHYRLDDPKFGSWRAMPDVAPRAELAKTVDEAFEAWLMDPVRRKGDTYIVNEVAGPLVVGISGLETARTLSYAEANDLIVKRIRNGMDTHLRARLVKDMIARGSVVSPPELEDLVLDVQQERLDRLAADPLLKRARLQ